MASPTLPTVSSTACVALCPMSAMPVAILSLLFIYRYTLQGVGKTVIPTIAGIMELMMRVFAALVLTKIFGYIGLTTANPLAWFGSLVPLAITYYAFKRKYQRYS